MKRMFVSVLALLACWPAARAADAALELLPQAQVGAGTVTLGEVARIRTTDLELIRALVQLPIGRAPAAGQGVTLEREALAGWIQQRLRLPAVLSWSGPEQVRVVAGSRIVSGDQVAAAAGDTLRAWLAARSDRSDVQLAWSPRDVEAPAAGHVRLQPRPLAQSPLRSRMVVWVDVWVADRFVRTVPVSFAVQAWRDAPVAAAPLQAGAPLVPEQLARRPVDVAALDGAPLAQPGGEPARVRRNVAAGEALRARDVAAAPAVARGQWASLRSGEGAVVSETRVEVLQDGRPGDSVRVRQPGAMAQVTARVLGPGQLEILR